MAKRDHDLDMDGTGGTLSAPPRIAVPASKKLRRGGGHNGNIVGDGLDAMAASIAEHATTLLNQGTHGCCNELVDLTIETLRCRVEFADAVHKKTLQLKDDTTREVREICDVMSLDASAAGLLILNAANAIRDLSSSTTPIEKIEAALEAVKNADDVTSQVLQRVCHSSQTLKRIHDDYSIVLQHLDSTRTAAYEAVHQASALLSTVKRATLNEVVSHAVRSLDSFKLINPFDVECIESQRLMVEVTKHNTTATSYYRILSTRMLERLKAHQHVETA